MLEISLQLPIRLAVVQVHGVQSCGDDSGFEQLAACASRYHETHAARGVTSPGGVSGVEVARALFHALGIDPTRHRPCSEALLNRALKGRPQPRIGTLVDVGNWCSLDFLLPLGIYDREKIAGAVTLRRGEDAEGYLAINGRNINLSGRYLLADEKGPFGSPITDSQRCAVLENTTRTAIIVYAPLDYEVKRLKARAELLAERVVKHCGGEMVQNVILSGSGCE